MRHNSERPNYSPAIWWADSGCRLSFSWWWQLLRAPANVSCCTPFSFHCSIADGRQWNWKMWQVGKLRISFVWSAVEEVFGTFTPIEVSLTIMLMFYIPNTAESAPTFSVYSSDSNNSAKIRLWKQLFSIIVLNFGLLSKFLKWFAKGLQRQICSLGEQIKSYVSLIWSRHITLRDHFRFPPYSFFFPHPTISSIDLWRIDAKKMEKNKFHHRFIIKQGVTGVALLLVFMKL